MASPFPGAGDAVASAAEAFNRALDAAHSAGWAVTMQVEMGSRQIHPAGGWPQDVPTPHIAVELSRKVGP